MTGRIRSTPLLGAALLASLATLPLAAQSAAIDTTAVGTIPWFPLGSSPIALHGDARQNVYLSAVGRRAIAMGTEDGRLELWSWPVKWLHDFQLAFRVPKYTQPILGRDVARSVTTRPEGVTIEYAYESFTVRQHIFVPLDEPAVVMLLEVDAIRPMDIIATFTPDIHFAWPAGLGGQYLIWDQGSKAFLFSEPRRRVNAYLGSPAVTEASDVPAHMLSAAPPQLVLGVGGAAERYTPPVLGEPPGKGIDAHVAYIPIVLAGGEMPRDSALALYRRLIAPGAAEREWKRRVAHEDSLRTMRLSIHSPDSLLDRAVEWAKAQLDEAYVCNPDLGCGLVAGYGLSGAASDRPGFGWFFGGDASINSFAMTGTGLFDDVRNGAFRFFAKYQPKDGKITHEISQGAGQVDWFGAYPYAFYHGDTSPFWILAFGEYWKQSGDTALLRELWPNIRKAYEWSRATDSNGDGLMENPLAGAGAIEVGDLQLGIVSDVYMSGVWVAALDRFARMAVTMHEPKLAAQARAIRTKAVATLESKLWLPSLHQYAFALLDSGRVNDNLTAWPATAMSFGVLDERRGADMAAKLASSSILTDWGARPLASTSPLFDPLHYNNGAVWPFVTGFVSLAEYRYHNADAGWQALQAIARTGFDESRGNNPEVISGRLYKPLDTAVPQQFFATSMVLTPLIRGLLGLDVDVPARRLTMAPHLPPQWDSLRVDAIPFGDERVDIVLRQRRGEISATATRTGGASGAARAPIDFVFSPALPLGATVAVGGAAATHVSVDTTPGDVHATVRAPLAGSVTLAVRWTGGWSAWPVGERAPAIGDRSSNLRVLSQRLADGRLVVALEGLAGRRYVLALRGPSGAAVAIDDRSAGQGGRATIEGPASTDGASSGDAVRVAVTMPAGPADADGYVPLTLTVSAGGVRSAAPPRAAPRTRPGRRAGGER